MSNTTNTAPVSVLPLWQDSPYAKWMCPVSAELDDDSPWSGYMDVDADARTQRVRIGDHDLTPDEARQYARAVLAAADHADHFTDRAADALQDLSYDWPELGDLPTETQHVVREQLRAAAQRIRNSGSAARTDTAQVAS